MNVQKKMDHHPVLLKLIVQILKEDSSVSVGFVTLVMEGHLGLDV